MNNLTRLLKMYYYQDALKSVSLHLRVIFF